jgi:uncharacterized membrane protein
MSSINLNLPENAVSEIFAIVWFLFCWAGYSYYSKWRSNKVDCLASIMHAHRKEWALQIVRRDNRIPDVSSIGTLEHTATFFASSSLIILAALAAALGAIDEAFDLFQNLSFGRDVTILQWEVFIICLMIIYVYAFFKISWSLRQYGFVVAMIGALPDSSVGIDKADKRKLAFPIAKTLSSAAYHFNAGLRCYYFSLAALTWLISWWALFISAFLVVYELHRREFRSRLLKNLLTSFDDVEDDSVY